MEKKKRIEVVIPCYNEEECIPLIYQSIHEVAKKLPEYQVSILYVDDGSGDASFAKIKEVSERADENEVHYISFARNFGKEAAIYAGLKNSTADYIALMDADLQHPPELLLDMVKGIEEGYECCGARRVNRNGEPPIRSAFSRLFYSMAAKLTSTKMEQGTTDYRLMSRRFVNAVLAIGEKNRFTKGIFAWVGFDTKWIEYENVERAAGNTKWSFSGLLRYAVNGFMSFATAPLRGAICRISLRNIHCAKYADFRWNSKWICLYYVCYFIYRKYYYSATWNYWGIFGTYLYGSEKSTNLYR